MAVALCWRNESVRAVVYQSSTTAVDESSPDLQHKGEPLFIFPRCRFSKVASQGIKLEALPML